MHKKLLNTRGRVAGGKKITKLLKNIIFKGMTEKS